VAQRVSIIVPAYNAEAYLAEALDSALAQDWPAADLEVVVVDDGSTDGTAAVIGRYGDRIVARRRENGGLCAAVGTGLESATGDLITFLDADDVLRPDKVRRQAEMLAGRRGTGLVYSDLELMDADGRPTAPSFFAAMGITPHTGRVLGALVQHNFIPATLMVHGDLRHRFEPVLASAPAQDWFIALSVAAVTEVAVVREPLHRYRRHDANMNLGAAARAGLTARNAAFRRWFLETLDLSSLEPAEIAAAVAVMHRDLTEVERELGTAPVVTAADRERAARHRAAASALIGEGRDATAAASLAAASACDPRDGDLTATLDALARRPAADSADGGERPYIVRAAALTADASLVARLVTALDADPAATLVVALPHGFAGEVADRIVAMLERTRLTDRAVAVELERGDRLPPDLARRAVCVAGEPPLPQLTACPAIR
jgi:glycosyltransferase involved in cell wall biosynthesis